MMHLHLSKKSSVNGEDLRNWEGERKASIHTSDVSDRELRETFGNSGSEKILYKDASSLMVSRTKPNCETKPC